MKQPLETVQNAWKLMTSDILPLPAEAIPLTQAPRRRLAAAIRADRDNPPADRTTMDGFALRSADLESIPASLRVIGEIPAGAAEGTPIEPRTCVRIFTGANLPPGADAVVPVEMTSSGSFAANPNDTEIRIDRSFMPGANVIDRGDIIRAGSEVLSVGTRLDSRQLAVAASVGVDQVSVYRLPRIRILVTGRELRDTRQSAAGHQTRDSNGPLVETAMREAGCVDIRREIVCDDPDTLNQALQVAISEADVVLVTGGVSAGKYDFVPDAIAHLGGRLVFRGLKIKPGKPLLLARMPDDTLVFGLPGNPLSVVTGLYEFALPAVRILSGCPQARCRPELVLPLGEETKPHRSRSLVVPAILRTSGTGTVVLPRPSAGSGDVIGGGLVEGGVTIEPGPEPIPAGRMVCFRPWTEWLS